MLQGFITGIIMVFLCVWSLQYNCTPAWSHKVGTADNVGGYLSGKSLHLFSLSAIEEGEDQDLKANYLLWNNMIIMNSAHMNTWNVVVCFLSMLS